MGRCYVIAYYFSWRRPYRRGGRRSCGFGRRGPGRGTRRRCRHRGAGSALLGGGGDGDGILDPAGGDVLPIGVGGDGGFEFGFGHGVEAVPVGLAGTLGVESLDFSMVQRMISVRLVMPGRPNGHAA